MNYYGLFKSDDLKSPKKSLSLSANCGSKIIDVNVPYIVNAKIYGVNQAANELVCSEERDLDFKSVGKEKLVALNIFGSTDDYLLVNFSKDNIGIVSISDKIIGDKLINGMLRGLAVLGYFEKSIYFSVSGTEFYSEQSIVSYHEDDLSMEWYFPIKKEEVIKDLAISKDQIYLAFTSGKFVCLDRLKGELSWEMDISQDQKVFCLDNIKYEVLDKLVVKNNIAALCSRPGYFIGIDLQAGNVKWVTELYATVKFTGQWNGDAVAIVDFTRLVILDTETGEIKSDLNIQGDIINRIKSEPFNVTKLDITDTHLWAAWGNDFASGPKGIITAINLSSGLIDWYEELENLVPMFGQFFICNNRLYYSTMGSSLSSPARRNYVLEGEGGYIPD